MSLLLYSGRQFCLWCAKEGSGRRASLNIWELFCIPVFVTLCVFCGRVEDELALYAFETFSMCLYILDSIRRLSRGICTRKGAGLSCSRSVIMTRNENFKKNPDSVPGTGASSVKPGRTSFPSPRCKRPETGVRLVARFPRAR